MNIENLIISKNIKQLEYKDRLSLFEIPNYLGKDFYHNLEKTFPDKKFFSEHNDFARTFNDENEKFDEFLENNTDWKGFLGHLKSDRFIQDLVNLFELRNVYSNRKSFKKYLPLYKKVRTSFCFNISEEGGFSLPHTDSSRKLVSMVLFFVDKSWSQRNGGQVILYKPKNKNDENNWRNKRVDKNNLNILKIISPIPNKIYGFKKTKNSYHSVENVNA